MNVLTLCNKGIFRYCANSMQEKRYGHTLYLTFVPGSLDDCLESLCSYKSNPQIAS